MKEKILVLCEGTNEETILNILLDDNKLVFTRDDMIGRRGYPIRQIDNPIIKTELKQYGLPVKIYRIGDKQTDEIKIPRELKNIVNKKEIYKYCTKPELEMLIILNENLESKYEKVKSSKITPKDFVKINVTYNGKKYDQSCDFLRDYFGGKNINNLINSIKKYKTYKKKHEKDELYLESLLKK